MNKRHYEHTLPNIRGSLSNTYKGHDKINFFYIFNSNITKFQKRDLVHPS